MSKTVEMRTFLKLLALFGQQR